MSSPSSLPDRQRGFVGHSERPMSFGKKRQHQTICVRLTLSFKGQRLQLTLFINEFEPVLMLSHCRKKITRSVDNNDCLIFAVKASDCDRVNADYKSYSLSGAVLYLSNWLKGAAQSANITLI